MAYRLSPIVVVFHCDYIQNKMPSILHRFPIVKSYSRLVQQFVVQVYHPLDMQSVENFSFLHEAKVIKLKLALNAYKRTGVTELSIKFSVSNSLTWQEILWQIWLWFWCEHSPIAGITWPSLRLSHEQCGKTTSP